MSIRLSGLYRVFVTAMLLGIVLVAGCSGSQENESANRGSGSGGESRSGEGSVSGDGESTLGSEPTGEQTRAPETTGDVAESPSQPERVLPDKWYVDSDGNEVPDFIEVEEGFDPNADDCAESVNCPGPSGVSGTSAVGLVSKEQNTLLILDSSGSMAEPIGGSQTKMDAARASLERYATATPDFINLGFMVYGHKGSNAEADRARSCESTELLEPLGEVDYRTFPQTLETFQPSGWTPIAGALEEAGDAFSGKEETTNRVILVSDGLETCGGDPVAAARELADANINVTIDVVGFDIPRSEEAQLKQIAKVSGGRYATASTAEELQGYFDEQERVFSELHEQWQCMNSYTAEVSGCFTSFNNAVTNHMDDFLRDAEGAEYYAMDEITLRAYNYLEKTQSRIYNANERRLAEIEKDMDEVERRMDQRYNEDVSFSSSCPKPPAYASLGKENLPYPLLVALRTPDFPNSSGP